MILRCAMALLLVWLAVGPVWAEHAGRDPRSPDAPEELVVLTWSEYIDPELVAAFERETGARVRFVYFESDEVRDDLLLQGDGSGYDVVLSSGVALSSYRKRGWLAPLTEQQVPNLRHIERRWNKLFPAAEGVAAAYFWGTAGIAYRADLVEKPITSWMDLYRPAPELQGRIAMVKYSRDVLGMALKALGFSANSSDAGELKQAAALARQQKPFVKTYTYVALDEQSGLATGQLAAALVYSGDALVLREQNPNIVYVLPAEGGNLWVDYFSVLDKSPHKPLAYRFIDFINRPKVAAQLAQFVYYATPNKAAERLLPADFLQNPIIYPDAEALARSEAYAELPPRVTRTRNMLFAELTL